MNQLIRERLAAMRTILLAGHSGGKSASSSMKGDERETFVKQFLNQLIPPMFRIGRGDITDSTGHRTGQIDLVIEYPFVPSMQLINMGPRIYLAEGVAAVIEVKSNLADQWSEVVDTARRVRPLVRAFGGMASFGVNPDLASPKDPIPFFAVGYTGWTQRETLEKHLNEGFVDGILVLDSGLFVGTLKFPAQFAPDDWCLWGLLMCLQHAMHIVGAAQVQMEAYAT